MIQPVRERECTATQAAKKLGMRRETFMSLVDEGVIDHRVVNGVFRRRVYIPLREVERLRKAQAIREKVYVR